MIVRGSREWIAAECPAPPIRSIARAASIPRRASGTRTSPSSGKSFSRASGSSGTTSEKGATSTRVLGGHPDARRLGQRLERPCRPGRAASDRRGRAPRAPLATSSGGSTRPPCRPSSFSNASATRSSTMTHDSLVQRMELSKLFESISRRAAAARSAVRSTSAGTFPGPTPQAGFPERYAARTTAVPPVATITSVVGSLISASISGIVGSSTTWMQPSGAPAAHRRAGRGGAPRRRTPRGPADAG